MLTKTVVPLEHAHGFVPRNLHHGERIDPRTAHVGCSGMPEVVKPEVPYTRLVARGLE